MMPIGPLMVEHRLIERVIEVLHVEADRIGELQEVDSIFVDTAVDFIRVYADRTHHGKEEDILFRDLAGRDLSAEDRRVMDELVAEHVYARGVVGQLVDANRRYLQGERETLGTIREKLDALVRLYPGHILKEDKVFFPASMRYLNRAEMDAMLEEMWAFDRRMIHEKYRSVAQRLEERSRQS